MTFLAGEIPDVNKWNTALDRAGCVVRRNANQSINSGSLTAVLFDTEDFDSGGFFTATSANITMPIDGIYTFSVAVDASTATGTVFQHLGFTSFIPNMPFYRSFTPSGQSFGTLSATVRLGAGDTAAVLVQHGTGSAINYKASLQCWRISS